MAKDALFPVNKGNATETGAGITITFVESDAAALGTQGPRVDGFLALGSLDNGELEIFISKSNGASVFHGSGYSSAY